MLDNRVTAKAVSHKYVWRMVYSGFVHSKLAAMLNTPAWGTTSRSRCSRE
jgi:hypothetical protein